MTEQQVQLVVASVGEGRQLRVNMVIDGVTRTFIIAPHVAASAIATLSSVLAKLAVDSVS